MDNIPVHLRITGLSPSNEDVDSRRAAIRTLATAWGKLKNVDDIFAKSAAIAASLAGDGQPTPELGAEVQSAVQKHASAFLYEDRPLEVGVCAGMAAISIMEGDPGTNGYLISDVYSNALWSALAFQPPLGEEKREKLRREVLDRAQERSLASANKARERHQVPDMPDLTVTIGEDGTASTNFKKATAATIEALRRNAALDREELDFLWWVQLNRSRLLGRPLTGMDETLRLIATGIEAAGHLRRLPADVHRDLVLRTVESDPETDLGELLQTLGDDRPTLGAVNAGSSVERFPTIFPLLHALLTGSSDASGGSEKKKASTWGARALLEGGLVKMTTMGLAQL